MCYVSRETMLPAVVEAVTNYDGKAGNDDVWPPPAMQSPQNCHPDSNDLKPVCLFVHCLYFHSMFAMVLPPRESREALDWTARQSRIEKIAAAGKEATLSAAHVVICCNVIYVVICVVINISIGTI